MALRRCLTLPNCSRGRIHEPALRRGCSCTCAEIGQSLPSSVSRDTDPDVLDECCGPRTGPMWGARVVVAAIHRPPHSACKSFSINGVLAYDRPCFPRRTPLAERESLGLPRPCADPASGSERSTPPTFRESERRSPARTGPAPATRPRCGASRRRRAALLLTGQLSECQRHPGICHGLDRTLPCRNHPVRPRS